MLKRYAILIFAASVIFCAGILVGQNKYGTPSTILHVVTVRWKADSTVDQQAAAIDGVKTMAAAIPGIKNIWIRKIKVQPATYSTAFAIQFENKAAFDRYTDAPAHRAWEKVYLPIDEVSSTHDITN